MASSLEEYEPNKMWCSGSTFIKAESVVPSVGKVLSPLGLPPWLLLPGTQLPPSS